MDSWASSLSPPVASDEPVCHPTTRSRQRRYARTRGHPRPTPAVTVPPVASAATAVPVLSTPVVVPTTAQPEGILRRTDKGKGRQSSTPASSSASTVDTPAPSASPKSDLTPEQYVCIVRMLKRLDEWIARGWESGVDESRLRSLAEIFDAAETVAAGGISSIRQADLAWRLADSDGWDKSAGSSIMGAIDIQVSVTKIIYKDYGDALLTSFRSFLGREEAKLGDSRRPCNVAGPPISQTASSRDSEPVVPKRVRFQEVDGPDGGSSGASSEWNGRGQSPLALPSSRIPSYDEACRSLAQHLAPLPELTPSAPNTPSLHSLMNLSSPSRPVVNSVISWPVEESLPTPILLADTDVSAATPSVIGPPTMTALVETLMEDLLTQEFSLVPVESDLLDEDV
ncbi:hypothetical protein SCLCIDRAFT_22715 [Scleroderma citrinum Foug A]|uniref:Uncharacterized protein n=1 Tax=Scleroderma citrinum Foug A TaxID=1036808 RepID=A0A0C2ZVN6_9AGAM|nr:hypothetical protein SCLCIDRAFT_22715 [Scleroderma citrinum Foug A]